MADLFLRNSVCLGVLLINFAVQAQSPTKANDSTTPLHLLKPSYPIPYGQPSVADVTGVLRRIYTYLDASTPTQLIDKETKKDVVSSGSFNPNAIFSGVLLTLACYKQAKRRETLDLPIIPINAYSSLPNKCRIFERR